jgi:hypothetical protein
LEWIKWIEEKDKDHLCVFLSFLSDFFSNFFKKKKIQPEILSFDSEEIINKDPGETEKFPSTFNND